jgi:hypothetical protein
VKKFYKLPLSLIAVVFLLLGCLGSANATLIKFTTSLDGAQASAGIGTGSLATGSSIAWFDDVTNEFSWELSWSGLVNVTNAHFHGPAASGANAGVVIGINFGNNPTAGNAILTALQAADLLNELWYINIHTATFPGGEIRGQVMLADVPAPATLLLFGMSLLSLVLLSTRKNKS